MKLEHRELLRRLSALANSGDLQKAIPLADRALKSGVEHSLPYMVLAQGYQMAGGFDEALGLLARALKLDEGDASLWVRLAGCLDAARRPKQAIEAYDRALALNPRLAAALEGKGRVLSAAGRSDEARALFEAALDADPGHLAAMMALAHLSAETGDRAEAKALSERALAARADFPEANWMLAQIAMAEGFAKDAETRLRGLLADRRLTPFQRADAELELGDALHAQERWTEAFAAYSAGKAAQHALFAQRAASRERETARARRLADWIATADPSTWTASSSDETGGATGHAFLLGFPRSGTTLLEQAFAGHTGVATLEEWPTLSEAGKELLDETAAIGRLATLSDADLAARRRRYWQVVRDGRVEARGKLFIDKQPGGAIHLPLIRRLFPDAKILFAVRDPRDVVLSCFRQNFQINALTYEFTRFEDAAACYDAFMSLADAARARLGLAWRDIRHETLVGDFEGEMRKACAFLGLDWSDALAEFAATAATRAVRTPSGPQVRAGLTDEGVGRWRDYAAALRPAAAALSPWVERFRYPAT
jgi:tetratricopeptide (TPR) repeat protein